MSQLPLEGLGVFKMASGRLYLNLSEQISWESYPHYAEYIVHLCDGVIKDKIESPDVRIWIVAIAQQEIRLVYEDYPQIVSLESCSCETDQLIQCLYTKLKALKEG